MKTVIFFSIVVLLFGIRANMNAQVFEYSTQFHGAFASEVRSENSAPVAESWHSFSLEAELSESSEKKRDPAYKLYKEGYNLILEERWEEARKTFAEVVKKYPKSDYVDDAEYWSAFALKHLDKNKAKESYKKFILNYPISNYYDDAVADYSDLNKGRSIGVGKGIDDDGAQIYILGPKARIGVDGAVVSSGSDSLVVAKSGKVVHKPGKNAFSYGYAFAPSMKQAERQLRLAQQMQHHISRYAPFAVTPPVPPKLRSIPGGMFPDEEKLDPEVRLKMDALYALGDTKEDSISFRTLRDVAIDRTQPRELRQAAMDALSNFTQLDVLPVFLEVVKKDTNEEIQNVAIDYMGQLSKNKNRSVETLAELFHAIPEYRNEQRQTVLSSIAEIGNDKAVDFLANIARTHEDYDLRSDAIYYLGNIGGEKARSALYDILKGK